MIPRYRAWGRNGNYPGTPSEKFEMFYDVSVVTTYQDKVQHVIADFGMYNESEYNGTEIIDYTLMQSTGLTDKNGKEIFEGDVVTDGHTTGDIKNHATYGFYMVDDNGVERWFSDNATLEDFEEDVETVHRILKIIGNIWEDGELLDGENTEEN